MSSSQTQKSRHDKSFLSAYAHFLIFLIKKINKILIRADISYSFCPISLIPILKIFLHFPFLLEYSLVRLSLLHWNYLCQGHQQHTTCHSQWPNFSSPFSLSNFLHLTSRKPTGFPPLLTSPSEYPLLVSLFYASCWCALELSFQAPSLLYSYFSDEISGCQMAINIINIGRFPQFDNSILDLSQTLYFYFHCLFNGSTWMSKRYPSLIHPNYNYWFPPPKYDYLLVFLILVNVVYSATHVQNLAIMFEPSLIHTKLSIQSTKVLLTLTSKYTSRLTTTHHF